MTSFDELIARNCASVQGLLPIERWTDGDLELLEAFASVEAYDRRQREWDAYDEEQYYQDDRSDDSDA